jgi:sugar lactone lactonase YvrE
VFRFGRTALCRLGSLLLAVTISGTACAARGGALPTVLRSRGPKMRLRLTATAMLAGLLVATGALAASYLIVPNNDNNSAVTGRLHRFDAASGASIDAFISTPFGLPNGTAMGPDGLLYVATMNYDANGMFPVPCDGSIQRYDPNTGAFVSTFVPSGSGGLAAPFEITFGPDGNLYVANTLANDAGNVLKYDGQTGAFLGVIASGLVVPHGLVFGPDGTLYVGHGMGIGNSYPRISRYDVVNGTFLGDLVAPFTTPLSSPESMVFGPDGALYVVSAWPGDVLRYDGKTGAFLGEFVAAPSDVEQPLGLVFGPDGNLYVNYSDAKTHYGTVRRYDGTTGQFIDDFVALGSGGLGAPRGGMRFVSTPSPAVSWSVDPATLSFARQLVGTSSAPQTVRLHNTGSAPFSVTSISVLGDFSQKNACSYSVAVGSWCDIKVTFTPTTASPLPRSGSVIVATTTPVSPIIIPLGGVGFVAPVVRLPSSLIFGNQNVGTTGTRWFTLSNVGNGPLVIWDITASGYFAQTNTCGGSVAPGAYCTFKVTFTPPASGEQTGHISIMSNLPGNFTYVQLSGTGIAVPVINLSATLVPFSDQTIGTTSAAKSVTIRNVGTGPLNIRTISASGDFAPSTTTCGSAVPSGSSCNVSVTFTPTATGARAGALTIASDAAGNPTTVNLSGKGIAVAPVASLSVSNIPFGDQAVGVAGAPRTVTLRNTGSAPLVLAAIATSGDFAQTNDCGAGIAVGSSCAIAVRFTPKALGPQTGALTVSSNAGGTAASVALFGTGIPPTPIVRAPTSVLFGTQAIGSSSARSFALINAGTGPLPVSGVAVSGDFSHKNSCGTEVAPGSSCMFTVTFTPTAAGARTGAITITHAGTVGATMVSLSGTGF